MPMSGHMNFIYIILHNKVVYSGGNSYNISEICISPIMTIPRASNIRRSTNSWEFVRLVTNIWTCARNDLRYIMRMRTLSSP